MATNNQLLPQFLRCQSQTLERCFRHIDDMHLSFFEEKKNIFGKIMASLDFEISQDLADTEWQVYISNSSHSFLGLNLKLNRNISDILKMCLFEEKNHF